METKDSTFVKDNILHSGPTKRAKNPKPWTVHQHIGKLFSVFQQMYSFGTKLTGFLNLGESQISAVQLRGDDLNDKRGTKIIFL